ncbi:MAG: multi-sensor signal transduction histidine kinase [Acidobacteria bacterium]|nr:multi-sensor signal transduction histidine kinase [Acidobacteriota bacterium]
MDKMRDLAARQEKSQGRVRRYVLAAIVFLTLAFIATRLFLHQTSVGSPNFVRMTFLLWTATIAVVLALAILATILGRNLIKIYFERRSGRLGSGFKSKIVGIFVALSLLPAVLLFSVAYNLISFSIDQWFSAPTAQMAKNSKALVTQYYEETQQRSQRAAEMIAADLHGADLLHANDRAELARRLAGERQKYQLASIKILDGRGTLRTESGQGIPEQYHKSQLANLISKALNGQAAFEADRAYPDDALTEVLWAAASLRDNDGKPIGVVLTEAINPHRARFKADSVEEALGAYEQLQQRSSQLRVTFIAILGLSTLLIVFAFSWFGMYLAKRVTVPIEALAEGAVAVASGNLDYRVECDAFDELNALVVSFNRMTADLQENKKRIEAAQDTLQQTNAMIEDRRRYMETILQTIATGVVSLDNNYKIRTINRAAAQMLEIQNPAKEAGLEDIIQGAACDALRMLLHKSTVLGRVMREIELELPGRVLHLATTITPLTDSTGQRTGWVVVLDDVSELIRIEKMAAWQEVARRLAHEIKNPLTPIQLSAERALSRYQKLRLSLGGEEESAAQRAGLESFDGLLEECVRTITAEADSLKNLVDEFSKFARLPEIKAEDSDLHRIIENTLTLYNGHIQDVKVLRVFAGDIPLLRLDPEQMKRVFINLFDNALEAMDGSAYAKVLQIRTSRNDPQNSIRIEVCDTGRGFPKEYQDSLFLPYFSTRKGGTGLGLAIVRQIILDHHGSVRAEPNMPLGTRIVIDLPMAPVSSMDHGDLL